jgi:transcriptional regulator with XRE-family HTH domain
VKGKENLPIGMELRLRRTEMKLSLAKMADRVGISENYLSEIERGEKTPSDEIIRKLAKAFDLDEKYLFARYDRIPLVVQEELKENRTLLNTLYEITQNPNLSDRQKADLYEKIQKLYKEIID